MRATRLTTLAGAVGYVGLMAAGYAYNLTFIQLGLTTLGREHLAMADDRVALAMAGLAIGTSIVAVVAGWLMRGWSARPKLAGAAVEADVLVPQAADDGLLEIHGGVPPSLCRA